MSNADTVIAALRTGYDRLADQVKKLSDDDLARGSAAAEWDVAQVLSHLGSGSEIMGATLEGAIEGKPAPAGDFNQTVWDRWNALPRREQADGFLEHAGRLTALFESFDSEQRESLQIDLGYLKGDVASVGLARLSELTLHSWDVRSTFEWQATLDPAAVALLVDRTGNLSWISKPAALNNQYAVLRVTTTEPTTEFTLHLNDPVSIDTSNPANPDGTLTLPAETWIRLSTGRLTADDKLEITGPVTLETLRKVFPGF